MKKVFGVILALGLANIVGATPVIIDSFTDTQNVTIVAAGASPMSGNISAPGAIGGTRAIVVTRILGNGQESVDVNSVGNPGFAAFNTDSNDAGTADFIYDGDANTTLNVPGFALPVDLTDGGLNNLIRFGVRSDQAAPVSIWIYTDSSHASVGTFALPAGTLLQPFQIRDLLFASDFATASGFANGANFASVVAVKVTIDGSSTAGLDAQIDFISADSSGAPEPASFVLIGGGLSTLAYLLRRRKAA